MRNLSFVVIVALASILVGACGGNTNTLTGPSQPPNSGGTPSPSVAPVTVTRVEVREACWASASDCPILTVVAPGNLIQIDATVNVRQTGPQTLIWEIKDQAGKVVSNHSHDTTFMNTGNNIGVRNGSIEAPAAAGKFIATFRVGESSADSPPFEVR